MVKINKTIWYRTFVQKCKTGRAEEVRVWMSQRRQISLNEGSVCMADGCQWRPGDVTASNCAHICHHAPLCVCVGVCLSVCTVCAWWYVICVHICLLKPFVHDCMCERRKSTCLTLSHLPLLLAPWHFRSTRSSWLPTITLKAHVIHRTGTKYNNARYTAVRHADEQMKKTPFIM